MEWLMGSQLLSAMARTLSRNSKWSLSGVQGRRQVARFATASSNHPAAPPPPPPSALARRLEGKVAIVTGGASGIGAATVRTFMAHGARVIIADIQDALGESLSAELGPNAHYAHCDVSQEPQVAAAVDLAVSKYGALDIMFNNAGLFSGRRPKSSFSELDMSDFEQVFNLNVKGVAHGVKHAARVMIPSNSGTILSMASLAHLLAGLALHPYTISKHAIVGMTKSAACELAHYGIRVNCISPAGVKTSMLVEFGKTLVPKAEGGTSMGFYDAPDLRRLMLDPDEVARAALFLASDDSRFISGHDLVVDGGFSVATSLSIFKGMQMGILQLQESE